MRAGYEPARQIETHHEMVGGPVVIRVFRFPRSIAADEAREFDEVREL